MIFFNEFRIFQSSSLHPRIPSLIAPPMQPEVKSGLNGDDSLIRRFTDESYLGCLYKYNFGILQNLFQSFLHPYPDRIGFFILKVQIPVTFGFWFVFLVMTNFCPLISYREYSMSPLEFFQFSSTFQTRSNSMQENSKIKIPNSNWTTSGLQHSGLVKSEFLKIFFWMHRMEFLFQFCWKKSSWWNSASQWVPLSVILTRSLPPLEKLFDTVFTIGHEDSYPCLRNPLQHEISVFKEVRFCPFLDFLFSFGQY